MRVSRRHMLAAGLGAAAFPGLAFARAPGERRLVFIMLRGAMDGLAAVPPMGDPDYAARRRDLAFAPGDGAPALDRRFHLHPAMQDAYALYRAGELAIVHGVAPPHRTRSHFDAQNILEGGGVTAFQHRDGWLNRALAAIGGERAELGLAVAQTMPLALRGQAGVASWAPRRVVDLPETLTERIRDMYQDDPVLAPAFEAGLRAKAMAADAADGQGRMSGARGGRVLALAANASLAAEFLARPDGPRVAMIEGGGWDTHAGQGVATGRLARHLGDLSAAFAALKAGLGPAWASTVVVAATEFGRTASPNGAGGTDHGLGGAAFLAGGAVAGGRVLADWPGLATGALYQGRDLAATLDLRALLKGVLHDHMRAPASALARSIFPDSAQIRPMAGLIKG